MKVKVINNDNEDFGKEFKLRRMNYDQSVVNYPSSEGIKVFNNKDLDFITESDIDEFLLNNKDLLKIKLNRGISIALYKVLLECLESNEIIQVKTLNLLRDKYKVNKRGFWEKEILCVVNEKNPFLITATGQNFKKNNYNVNAKKIDKSEFLEICTFEIKKIEKEIKEKNDQLSRFGKAIKSVESTGLEEKLLN